MNESKQLTRLSWNGSGFRVAVRGSYSCLKGFPIWAEKGEIADFFPTDCYRIVFEEQGFCIACFARVDTPQSSFIHENLSGVKKFLKLYQGVAELIRTSKALSDFGDIAEFGEWRDFQ